MRSTTECPVDAAFGRAQPYTQSIPAALRVEQHANSQIDAVEKPTHTAHTHTLASVQYKI